MNEICPFAKKLKGNIYLCLVDGKESPDLFAIHTKRFKECPLYRKGLDKLKVINKCLVNAVKMGEEAIETVLEALKEGKDLPDKCAPPKTCKSCPCYWNGICLFTLERV